MIVTIRARLFWLVGVAMLPAMAILTYNGYLFRQRVFHDIEADARRVASLVGSQLQAQIEDTSRRCSLMARLPAIQAMDASSGRRGASGNSVSSRISPRLTRCPPASR